MSRENLPVKRASFTPGPWKVTPPQHGHPSDFQCVQIGVDEMMYSTLELLPADARLIAAAPELLAACNAVLMFHSGRDWDADIRLDWFNLTQKHEATTKALCDFVRAAIAQATGQEAASNG